MTSKLNYQSLGLIAVSFAITGLCWQALAGPNQSSKAETESASANETGLSGEELWTMNCQRCHNIRPPTMYSNAQWDVIVHHMRVRANITGEEQRAILEFLKSASH
jgi:cytochrome c5